MTSPTSKKYTTLILGGSGKVARCLTTQLLALQPPHTVYSVIRSPSQTASLTSLGATPIVHSLEDTTTSALATLITEKAPDYIVWAAGAGGGDPSRTQAVDKDAAIRTWDAVTSAQRDLEGKDAFKKIRLIVVSAADVRERSLPAPSWYKQEDQDRSERLWKVIGPYMEAKLAADRDLRSRNGERGLRYTIVRPGGLTDEEGKGTVSAGKVGTGRTVSRSDVAGVVLECMKEGVREGVEGRAFDVMGGDVGIGEAVREVVRGDVDTFRGFI